MELAEENQDGMDCRPPTGRDTGIKLSDAQEAWYQEGVARRKAARKRQMAPTRPRAEE